MTAPRQAEGTGAAPAPSPACRDHGRYTTYKNHGCRCAPCTAANAGYTQGYRESRHPEHEMALVTWDDEFARAWAATHPVRRPA